MRKEHTHHVIIIMLMMLIILAVFIFVILNHPKNSGITTFIQPAGNLQTQTNIVSTQKTTSASNIEIDILIGFLILLALLFIWYLGIKIAKELRK